MKADEIIKKACLTGRVKDSGRRSGRTTRMVARAVEAAEHELATILVARANQEREVFRTVCDFSVIAGSPITNVRIQSYENGRQPHGRCFVDHHVYELLIEKVANVLRIDSSPQCTDNDYVKDCIDGLMEELCG